MGSRSQLQVLVSLLLIVAAIKGSEFESHYHLTQMMII